MSVTIANFKYLVVRTGYTSRLNVGILEEKFEEKEISSQHYAEEGDSVRVMYIKDSVWGNGMKRYGDKDECNRINQVIGKMDGVIVLTCPSLSCAFDILDILMRQRYCAMFDHSTIMHMKLFNDEILVMEYDCESG